MEPLDVEVPDLISDRRHFHGFEVTIDLEPDVSRRLWITRLAFAPLPGGRPVESSAIRTVRVGELHHDVTRSWVMDGVPPACALGRLNDDNLRTFVNLFVRANLAGWCDPTGTAATWFGKTRPTAARWITHAYEIGLITAAQRSVRRGRSRLVYPGGAA